MSESFISAVDARSRDAVAAAPSQSPSLASLEVAILCMIAHRAHPPHREITGGASTDHRLRFLPVLARVCKDINAMLKEAYLAKTRTLYKLHTSRTRALRHAAYNLGFGAKIPSWVALTSLWRGHASGPGHFTCGACNGAMSGRQVYNG